MSQSSGINSESDHGFDNEKRWMPRRTATGSAELYCSVMTFWLGVLPGLLGAVVLAVGSVIGVFVYVCRTELAEDYRRARLPNADPPHSAPSAVHPASSRR